MRLQSFKNVGHQCTGEVARDALDGRGTFVEKGWQVGGGLVLAAKDIVLVLIEEFPVAIIDRHGDDQGDEKTRGLLRGGVVGKGSYDFIEDGAMQDNIGVNALAGGDAHPRTGGELPDHGVSERDFRVVALGMGRKDWYGHGARIWREKGSSANGVVAAAGENHNRGQRRRDGFAEHALTHCSGARSTVWELALTA